MNDLTTTTNQEDLPFHLRIQISGSDRDSYCGEGYGQFMADDRSCADCSECLSILAEIEADDAVTVQEQMNLGDGR